MTEIIDIQNQLIRASRSWGLKKGFDRAHTEALRNEAIHLNHTSYFNDIPFYRKLAGEEGIGSTADSDTIKRKLMLSADIFKSYDRSLLDNGDFYGMTQWLSGIYHRRIDIDMSDIHTIDSWIERLKIDDVHIVYSSGTSGTFSFVPRDIQDWELSRTANIACLASLLMHRLGNTLSGLFLNAPARLLSSQTLTRFAGKKKLTGFDAVFLGFRQGRMGNQVLIEELATLFRRHYFLYDIAVSGTALRCLYHGASTDDEKQMLTGLQAEVIDKKETNYLMLIHAIRRSTDEGQKVFIFGAPYQFRELCDFVAIHGQGLALKKGSFVFFGGGWKSFTGETIERETLVDMLSNSFDIPKEMVLEGYSMTEINMLMVRCEHGRFHIPPVIEPVIFDEKLDPIQGTDIKGAFGFLDPFAVSYPGFIISGDYVHMLNGECPCGLDGPAIIEIGRMPGSELKGCGGIMGSMKA